eukprot:symbB.v1.2.013963.t1/scaffold895.1/size184301/14
MAAGYDPIQRCQQWKRRVDREELAVCQNAFSIPSLSQRSPNPSSHQLDMLQQKLRHSAVYAAGQAFWSIYCSLGSFLPRDRR